MKITFGIAILWIIVELLIRPVIHRHVNNQLIESARKCYSILLAAKSIYESKDRQDDPEGIIIALNKYKDSIRKNPRLSKQTGHAEMYRKIRKAVSVQNGGTINDLLEDMKKLDARIGE
jgi:hypothetical protein